MPSPIIEDFAAIHARMRDIRDARECGWGFVAVAAPAPPAATTPDDFYTWLLNGALWATG